MNSTKPIISPNEVVEMTSGENIEFDHTRITIQIILVNQRRYIKPALGTDLYNAIVEGKYSDFTMKLIKPALALIIARAIIYSHTVRIGAGGVAIPVPINHAKPSKSEIVEVMDNLKKNADTLIKIAIEHIIASDSFPEFNASGSTCHTSTIGGLIIT